MKSKIFYKSVLSGLVIVVLGLACLIGIAIIVSLQSQPLQSLSQPTVAIASSSLSTQTVSALPTSTTLASTTQAVSPPTSPLVINNPTNIAVGEVINLPNQLYSQAGGITLRRTDKLPTLSVDQALDYNAGAPWERGGLWNGRQITVTVTFGLGSLGSLQAGGSWIPAFSPPEFTCTALRKCTPTGKSLQRIENHPMWVIDYEGLPFCGTAACDSHTVFLINDVGGTIYYSFGYTPS